MVVVEKQKKLKLFIILQITRAQKYFFNRYMPCSNLSFLIAVKGSKKGLQFVYWWRVYLIMPFDLGLGRLVNINIIESVGTYPGYYNIVL